MLRNPGRRVLAGISHYPFFLLNLCLKFKVMEEQLVIKLKNTRKRKFLLELLGEFDFVEVVKSPNGKNGKQPKQKFTPEQQELIDGLKRALHEVELHQQGKIELPTLKEVLAEL